MRKMFKGRGLVYLLAATNILLLIALCYINFLKKDNSSSKISQEQQNFPFLSKRIFTENQNDILINFTPLRQAMRDYVNKQNGKVGVYFEYLPSGTSIGVNDLMEVKIASLVKIPVTMAAYKTVEEGKLDLNKTLTIDKEDLDDSFGKLYERGAGSQITVKEAIDLMLINSDNTATRVLTDELPEYAIEDVFDSLDIPKERINGFAVITPKSYTSILRSLYLASYINRENSNAILDTLSRTDFRDKLPSGVPNDIKVSHKIGVFDQESDHPVYSDCGLIYVPNRPYTVCIMTKDLDEETSRQHMQWLSKMIYGYVAQAK